MKQKNKNRYYNLSFAFITFSVILFGCLKRDSLWESQIKINQNLSKEFFNIGSTNDIEIMKLANDIKKQDSLFNFLPNFVKKNGIPRWDKVLYKTNSTAASNSHVATNSSTSINRNSQGLFFIPLKSQNSNEIKSYITAYKHNDSLYTYRLYNKDSLNSIQAGTTTSKNNLQATQAVFGYFEKTVNNQDSLKILKPTKATLKNVNITLSNKSNDSITTNSFPTSECSQNITVTILYTIVIYDENGDISSVSQFTVSMVVNVPVDCGAGGVIRGGSFQIGGGGQGGDPFSGSASGNGFNWGGNYWWNYGTGYPWPTSGNNGGGSFDPNWNWWWTGTGNNIITSTISTLSLILNLDTSEISWLSSNTHLAEQILNYVQTSTNPNAKGMAKEHLDKLISDLTYKIFSERQFQSGNSSIVWWEDDVWLDNPNNFNLDITRENNQYENLTADEKILIKIYPQAAYTIKENMDEAFAMSDARYGPDGGLNDKKDAFRHAFFNSINTRDVLTNTFSVPPEPSSSIVRKFGIAHESETPTQLLLEKQMDLHNNEKGISYCLSCLPFFSTNENIADAIIDILDNGNLIYLKPVLTKSQDPNYFGVGGIANPKTATHGITPLTKLTPTDK